MWTDNSTKGSLRARRRDVVSAGAVRKAELINFYLTRLTEVSMSRFKWHGLPEGIPERYIESTLFSRGLVIFFKHDFYNRFFALSGLESGHRNVYNNPTEYTAMGNGIMRPKKLAFSELADQFRECVPIYANNMRIGEYDTVLIYARRLAEIDISVDVNVKSTRHPKIFRGTANTRLSMINVSKQIDDGNDFIMVTDEIADSLDALDMGVDPLTFEKMHILRSRVFNECMGFLGVDGANQDKKERLVEGELEANIEQTNLARRVALNARETACRMINETWPELNVRVEYVGDMENLELQGSELEGENV